MKGKNYLFKYKIGYLSLLGLLFHSIKANNRRTGMGLYFNLKKVKTCIFLLLFVPVILKAGWIEEKEGKTIIHVSVASRLLPDPSNTDTFSRAESSAVKAFRKRFPEIFKKRWKQKYLSDPSKYGKYNWDNVEIDIHKSTGIKVEGVEVDLLQIAGDDAPDILYLNFRKSDNYVRNRFLYPLDKYFAMMTDEQKDFRINKKIWPVIKRIGPDGKKHVWALPYAGALGRMLLYRKDIFDRHNLDYPTLDWTWDDMLAAAKVVTEPDKGIYGLLLGRGKHESWYWCNFLWSAGGEVMEYNEKKNEWRCVFDSDEAAIALDYYIRLSAEKWIDKKGLIRRGYSSKDASENSWAKWDRGEIAMMHGYIDERVFATINPEVTGMVPVPFGPTGIRGAELNSRMMGLYSGIKNPVIRDAAWEYMRFYDSKEAAAIKTKIMVEGGLGRFVNPKYLIMFGYPEVVRLAPKGWSDVFEIAIKTGRPEPHGKNSNIAYDMMTYPIQEAEQLARNDALPENDKERLAILKQLLIKANAKANEIMIGIIPHKEMKERRIVAVIVLIFVLTVLLFLFRIVLKTFATSSTSTKKSWRLGGYKWAVILLVPAVLTILIWQYIPLVRGSIMAFFDYKLVGKSTFVFIDNFANLLYNSDWWLSAWNSLRYSLLVIVLTFIPPIILAIGLQEIPRGSIFFRIVYYLPAVITGLVTIILWKQFYEPSEKGALNSIILNIPAIVFILVGLGLLLICFLFAKRLFLNEMYISCSIFIIAGVLLFYSAANLAQPILFPSGEKFVASLSQLPFRLFNKTPEQYYWLSDPDTAMLSCVIPMFWAGIGPGCLIYLAALKGIPEEYYEAADIDGAGFLDKILFVVIPTLKALIIINFVGVFIGSWINSTANILVMTGGGANTETAGLHIWKNAFTYLQLGPACAMAWTLGFLLIGFTVYQLKLLSKVEFKAAANQEK